MVYRGGTDQDVEFSDIHSCSPQPTAFPSKQLADAVFQLQDIDVIQEVKQPLFILL